MLKNNFFILTGGPGSGKSSLLSLIEETGLLCVPEVARILIKDQLEKGGNALPWGDLTTYSRLMMEYSVADYEENLSREETVFFDRGIPDTIGYLKLIGHSVPKEFLEYAQKYRYNSQVFILPPWKEIYVNDIERKQSFKEAEETYDALLKTYQELKYQPIVVERTTIGRRLDFVLSKI